MDEPYRLATDVEINEYEAGLYPLQNRILDLVGKTYGTDVVLTRGTALARQYFGHRYSDDIDLFTSVENPGLLGNALGLMLEKSGFTIEPLIQNRTFYRANASNGLHSVRIDVAPDFHLIDEPMMSRFGVYVHSLRDLAANKISAFENRSEVKDVIDLYYLSREFSWEQMFEDAAVKIIPVAYEDLQHLMETPLSVQALIFKPITQADFRTFLATLKNEVASEVKKKIHASMAAIDKIVESLLWDTPKESRTINEYTRRVLQRRAQRLALPDRIAVLDALGVETSITRSGVAPHL